MLVQLRLRIGTPAVNNLFGSILSNQKPKVSQTQSLEMVTQAASKRPMCPSCSKPTRLCLCTRLKTPNLENPVGVTILQHVLEKKHPLNSARIANLGLKNVNVESVSDINFEAQFVIRVREPDCGLATASSEAERQICALEGHERFDFVDEYDSNCGDAVNAKLERFSKAPGDRNASFMDTNGKRSLVSDIGSSRVCSSRRYDTDLVAQHESSIKKEIGTKGTCSFDATEYYMLRRSGLLGAVDEAKSANEAEVADDHELSKSRFDPIRAVPRGINESAITCTIKKYGVISSLSNGLIPQHIPTFHQLLASPAAQDALAKGFVVKKLQKKQLNGSIEWEGYEEFEIAVPPGTVLLFPSKKSVGVEAIDFEVRNLIVLDGTWAKAKRMYNENPWLQLLPHLKLDLEKMSLYGEVRHQPKAGCLSTIESIVYALKAVGNNPEGLDNLLDVFESMVGDQRRCKYERLGKLSPL